MDNRQEGHHRHGRGQEERVGVPLGWEGMVGGTAGLERGVT